MKKTFAALYKIKRAALGCSQETALMIAGNCPYRTAFEAVVIGVISSFSTPLGHPLWMGGGR